MSMLIANYEAQRKAFVALLQRNCHHRILLFHGESGSGKTTLLNSCLEQIPTSIPHVEIQLRNSMVGMAEVFYRTSHVLTWDRLLNFTERLATLEGMPKVQIDHNWLMGINNRIRVVLGGENLADRDQRRTALTDAWFDDAAMLQGLILMVFDTYEQAATEVQDWISGPFLARVAQTDSVRVVVAGRTVPEKNNIEWGHCCDFHDLYGVVEAQHWLPIVQAMKRRIAVENPKDWLAGVCHALKGKPDDIMKVIEGLPREGSFA